jgi:hypothetical protein
MILTLVVFPFGLVFATMTFPSSLVATLVFTPPEFLIASPSTLAVMTVAARRRSRINPRRRSQAKQQG